MITMWTDEKIHQFRKTLLNWYDQAGRKNLPWRQDQDPYHVWVSEIMLQQTQVNTVIPYYQRFMTLFPTVEALASAPEEQLLKAWEGLGYYSRVRNMQKAAQQLVTDGRVEWPQTMKELEKLKGIGPYTAAAIASIAFLEPVAAIDGNAFRVLARLFKIDADIRLPRTRQLFFEVGNQLIDPKRPGDFNQAIMDLGSSYMTAKNYDSEHSPVKAFNAAYQDGTEDFYPVKSKARPARLIHYFAIRITSPSGYLFEKRPKQGLLANIWTMPLYALTEFTEDPEADWQLAEMVTATEKRLKMDYGIQTTLKPLSEKAITHVYSHQKWQVMVLTGTLDTEVDVKRGQWQTLSEIAQKPQPKVQEKIWQHLRAHK